MKKIGKILSCLLAAVLLVTGLTISAGAESIYDTASAIQSGKEYSTKLYNTYDTADYKITVSKTGDLNIKIAAQMYETHVYVYDSDGNTVQLSESETTSGSSYDYGYSYGILRWNSTIEKYAGTLTYGVKKGTYYIRFEREYGSGNGKISFTATYPSSSTSKSAKISYLSMTLGKGSSVQLGTVLSGSSSQKVTWTSSKSSVVSVSSSGKISCKKKGTATITAKLGSSKVKIKIKVK